MSRKPDFVLSDDTTLSACVVGPLLPYGATDTPASRAKSAEELSSAVGSSEIPGRSWAGSRTVSIKPARLTASAIEAPGRGGTTTTVTCSGGTASSWVAYR